MTSFKITDDFASGERTIAVDENRPFGIEIGARLITALDGQKETAEDENDVIIPVTSRISITRRKSGTIISSGSTKTTVHHFVERKRKSLIANRYPVTALTLDQTLARMLYEDRTAELDKGFIKVLDLTEKEALRLKAHLDILRLEIRTSSAYEGPSYKTPGWICFRVSDIENGAIVVEDVSYDSQSCVQWIREGEGLEYFLQSVIDPTSLEIDGIYVLEDITGTYVRGDGYVTDDDVDWDVGDPRIATAEEVAALYECSFWDTEASRHDVIPESIFPLSAFDQVDEINASPFQEKNLSMTTLSLDLTILTSGVTAEGRFVKTARDDGYPLMICQNNEIAVLMSEILNRIGRDGNLDSLQKTIKETLTGDLKKP